MPSRRYIFTPPRLPIFRWLVDPGNDVPDEIRNVLLGEIFASPNAVIAGLVNGLILNTVALCLHTGIIFAIFMALDVLLVATRLIVVRLAMKAATSSRPAPTDLYLFTAICWSALQGAMACSALHSCAGPLQILGATTAMALVGPICARNYAAPRYALLLVALTDLPFVGGAALTQDRWLLILLAETPLFLLGVIAVVRRFQLMAIRALKAELDGTNRARHDSLTGLLNRRGLLEALEADFAASQRFIMFYLDLDGFKPINDTFGHHAGDAILGAVAARLRAAVRSTDIVARLGGDEFVIVVPDMPPEHGAALAESVIRRITDEPYLLDNMRPLRIGVSIGFACVPEDASARDDLHRKADAALYEAKAAGKGTHRRYSPLSTPRPPSPTPAQPVAPSVKKDAG
jgi:diguanylate cyclase (GGDEF)-like protein